MNFSKDIYFRTTFFCAYNRPLPPSSTDTGRNASNITSQSSTVATTSPITGDTGNLTPPNAPGSHQCLKRVYERKIPIEIVSAGWVFVSSRKC